MINSRWPRPIGTNESTALIPVCMGSLTEIRGMIPGALIPTRNRCFVLTGPFPSIGLPGGNNVLSKSPKHSVLAHLRHLRRVPKVRHQLGRLQ